MSDEEDPEVLADLRLRASSMHDSSRTRAVDVNQLWQRPVLVTEWRCRFPDCRVMVGMDQDAVDRLERFNAELARRRARGEADAHPIETHQIMICDAHKRLFDEKRAHRLRERVVELRDAIQQIKASSDPRNEKALIEILHKRHHPDVDGLLQAIEERIGTKGKTKRRAL